MLAALACAVPAATAVAAPAGTVTVTARVGEELALLISLDGSVSDASTIPARIVRERRGDVVYVTIV